MPRKNKKSQKQKGITVHKKGKKKIVKSESKTRKFIKIITFAFFGTFLILSYFGAAGVIGDFINGKIIYPLFGMGAILLPLLLLGYIIYTWRGRKENSIWEKIALPLDAFAILGLFGLVANYSEDSTAGLIGDWIGALALRAFDVYVAFSLFIVLIAISSIILIYPLRHLLKKIFYRKEEEEYDEDEKEYDEEEEEYDEVKRAKEDDKKAGIVGEDIVMKTDSPYLSDKDYVFPTIPLLNKTFGKPAVGDIKANANQIQRTLRNFGINVEMDEVTIGPTVTRYALKPAEGVKLSRIVGLQNDLALALAAKSIRIEAPIPGKSLVGIEVPNKTKSIIGLGSLISEPDFQKSNYPLLITLGKGVSGKSYFSNLSKMPHVLIAGATGSGKSVTVHNFIISMLYKNTPDMLKFIMVDPKRVELTTYNKIPHLLTPVLTNPKKAILALKWVIKEMERRYDILEAESVRDIASYHSAIVKPAYDEAKRQRVKDDSPSLPEKMPYIVIIIDELADLMSTYPRELEAATVRLAQMSRAVGIHLILSTQRPSVNVITGLIKANIPARIALKVSSQVDSRTILDTSGAEKLLGAGDMLFISGEMAEPERIQCAFVSEDEVKRVVKFIRKNNSDDLVEEIILPDRIEKENGLSQGIESLDDDDPLLDEAREIIIETKKASTSYLQRKLRIGYSRAARLIDILEEQGVVGPAQGSRPREVLDDSIHNDEKLGEDNYQEEDDE